MNFGFESKVFPEFGLILPNNAIKKIPIVPDIKNNARK